MTHFIAYAVQGLVDGIRDQIDQVRPGGWQSLDVVIRAFLPPMADPLTPGR